MSLTMIMKEYLRSDFTSNYSVTLLIALNGDSSKDGNSQATKLDKHAYIWHWIHTTVTFISYPIGKAITDIIISSPRRAVLYK